jgi:hypothetical protein
LAWQSRLGSENGGQLGSRGAQIGANILLALGVFFGFTALIPTRVWLWFSDWYVYFWKMPKEIRTKTKRSVNVVRLASAYVAVLAWVGFLVVWLVKRGIRICWNCNP